jgi:hypothetical protein
MSVDEKSEVESSRELMDKLSMLRSKFSVLSAIVVTFAARTGEPTSLPLNRILSSR